MRPRRSRIPWTLVWLALLFLTLRPFGPLERVVELSTVPLRLVAELASPLTVLHGRRVRAAERALGADALRGAAENERLLADLGQSALPTEPALVAGRRVVHAEVLGHQDLDHLVVRLRDPRGVAPGMPVACGDAYVGRVARLATAGEPADRAIVKLVTASDAFVGAAVGDGQVLMTVGGVVTGKRTPTQRRPELLGLAVHYPSGASFDGELVRVHELFRDEEPWADLAEGLRLGVARRHGATTGAFLIEPELDYLDGLYQVVVLTPPDERLRSAEPFETVLYDSRWVRATPLSVGDPAPARATRKVRVGRRHGVQAGAAVTSIGGHLIGRVLRAGLATSDVALLGDVGFSLVAVARFEEFEEPQVLGRLIALGRDGERGAFAFRWVVRAPLDPRLSALGAAQPARLFSGSGDVGLPAGFALGRALLPTDARPGDQREVLVTPAVDPDTAHTLFVRTGGEDDA